MRGAGGGAPSGGSTMFAAINSRVNVDDLLHGALIQSGNDACIALAEGIAGSENEFAAMMTKRARELGLTRSTFGNSNGLPNPLNKMSVRELGRLARNIILTYPDYYKIFGQRDFTWNKISQQNRNPLLTMLDGADGLKTGYTKEGGYGMVGSAVQNDVRLIVVVNGLSDPNDRAAEAKRLLEWGFKGFEARPLMEAGQTVGYGKVFGGDSGSVALTTSDPVKVMMQKNGSEKLMARVVYQGPIRAPVQAGQQVGSFKVWRNNVLANEVPVYAAEAVGVGSTARAGRWTVLRSSSSDFSAPAWKNCSDARRKKNARQDASSPSRVGKDRANPPRSRYWPIACTIRTCAPS